MLHEVDLGRNVVGDRLQLVSRARDKKVTLLGGADLRLDLRGICIGHVHGATRFLLKRICDALERIGHARPAIDVERLPFE